MNRSFYNGVSGTKSFQYGLDTLANNIANVNTAGFKGKSAEFSTVFSQMLSESSRLPVSSQVGLGSRVHAASTDMSQGSLVTTDNLFDLAIAGEGWFAVKSAGETYYTRNGTFSTDAEGYLVDGEGAYLMAAVSNPFTPDPGQPGSYVAREVESIPLTPNPVTDRIFLPTEAILPAKPTTVVRFQGNLNPVPKEDFVFQTLPDDSYALTIDPAALTATLEGTVTPDENLYDPKPGEEVFVTLSNAQGRTITLGATLDENLHWKIEEADIASLDPLGSGPITADARLRTFQQIPNTAHFRAPIIAGNGEKAFVDMRFVQEVPVPKVGSTWRAQIRILQDYGPYDPNETYDPDLFFVDEESDRVYTLFDSREGSLAFNDSGALLENTVGPLDNAGVAMELNLGTPYDPTLPNSGYDGLTTFGNQPTASKSETHDGYEKGVLKGYIAADDGTLYANFSNSRTTAVAKIPIYQFINDQGLSAEGGVYYKPTSNSGQAYLYTDAAGNVIETSRLRSYTLEMSNVSLNNALTEMIVMQKAFDANAKSITTSDQMIQQAINMKK